VTEASSAVTMDKIVSLCKRRGFVFPGSEIYGGLANAWDYGPIGVELKRNVKEAWWREVVRTRDDVVGLDAAILMNPSVWEASGHLSEFTDPLVECKECKHRFRSDHVESGKCPDCGGELGESRQFNLMLKTFLGAVEDTASTVFMRPETAQGMFVNFLNIQTATRKKLPFGIAQIGKSFRNEITPGNFIFRTREFEQMEMEFFTKPPEHLQPGERNDDEWHEYWVNLRFEWYLRHGIRKENLRLRVHETAELAHYAKATTDIEYLFPWGWGEMEGIANRTDFDLKKHSEHSGTRLTYFDEQSPAEEKHYHPYVIEPAVGVDRLALMFLLDAYTEEEVGGDSAGAGKGETRVVLKFHPSIAPVQVALLPLSRNEKLTPLSREVYASLIATGRWNVEYDDAQSIGRRYRRFDEVGTPFCVTVDFDSLEDNQVTIRDRDTLVQDRVAIADLASILGERLG
jgi:glycyl-tRNA synthetase